MFKPNLRSMLRNSLHPFGVLSESIDELIDNKIIWGMIPKRLQNLLWQIDLRSGNLHHMSELDNWGGHEPFNKICCKLGRHDYFCHSLLKPRGGGDIGVVLKCMRCGYTNHTNIVNKQITVVSEE
mgnify:CR=1 FL=1